jgi:hypothetical protein
MGYQESFMTTTNRGEFDLILETVMKAYEAEWFEEVGAFPESIIVLKEEVEGHPIGTRFLYVAGERSGQRNVYDFLGDRIESLDMEEKLR